ncbi:MAG: hypothetical protein Q9165_008361 [Trypethelium subeluteriae]
MPAIKVGSRDLLEYDASYGVLICRDCQYAIQRSALQSHLLRHKIYRDERQRLLSTIGQFHLFEPDDVPLPTPASLPIDGLPVISGYRCTVVGCGNLCASFKRMRRHQSEVHGISEPPNASSHARTVKLQTFFRGTKIKYFEVTSPKVPDTAGGALLATTGSDENGNKAGDEKHDGKRHDEETPHAGGAMSMAPQRVPTSLESLSGSSLVDLDLETLAYFHHFTTVTSLTLPSIENLRPAMHYWQTNVVSQALRQRWLMCGLLAISACHLAALTDDTAVERVHRERSSQLQSVFSAGWQETAKPDTAMVATGVGEEAKEAGRQINCILRCAHWASATSTLNEGIVLEPSAPSQLQSIMTTLCGLVIPNFTLYHDGDLQTCNHDDQEEMIAQARNLLIMRSSSDAGSFRPFSLSHGTPPALLDRLLALPSRMAETFGKPEDVRDVLAALSAIATLIECCEISFSSDKAEASWRGMTTWLTKVPDHFGRMILCHSAAALVVLAHWAASLVKRAEHCGCWFLRGLTKMLLRLIVEQLSSHDLAVQGLVESLIA